MKMKLLYLFVLVSGVFLQSNTYPEFEINVNDNPYPADLFIHITSQENRYMSILDTNMNLKWDVMSENMGMNFKPNGNNLSYFHKDNLYWILTNSEMREVDTLHMVNNFPLDYHECLLLPNGHYILQAYGSLIVDMSQLINGGLQVVIIKDQLVIQEFNSHHELIFEWQAWDYLDITDYTNLNLYAPEIIWMHGNSIEIDVDNHFVISNRTSSEIIKIHRQTGDVIWRLGGPQNEFSIENDPLNGFSLQHDVRIMPNGNYTLFDNGNGHETQVSRVVEYEIDETNKILSMVWEYTHPEGYFGLSMGSAQRLPNGNTLINWGSLSSSGLGTIITEVDMDKNIVLEIKYPFGYLTYRVTKSNWEFDIDLLVGDPNLDQIINVLDIVYLVNEVISQNPNPTVFDLYKIDLNRDGLFSVLDIVQLVSVIIEQ
jgi:hypothetical protein